MLKLKPQYFGHLIQRADSSEKTLIMEKTLESPLDFKESQLLSSKGNRS